MSVGISPLCSARTPCSAQRVSRTLLWPVRDVLTLHAIRPLPPPPLLCCTTKRLVVVLSEIIYYSITKVSPMNIGPIHSRCWLVSFLCIYIVKTSGCLRFRYDSFVLDVQNKLDLSWKKLLSQKPFHKSRTTLESDGNVEVCFLLKKIPRYKLPL